MLPTVETQTATIQERSARATRALCGLLGLGTLKPAELKFLALALTEVTMAEIEASSTFGERVCTALAEVKATYGSKAPSNYEEEE